MFRLMSAILKPIPGIHFRIGYMYSIPRIDHFIIQYFEHWKDQPTLWFITLIDFWAN
jgi:hypothetical protein